MQMLARRIPTEPALLTEVLQQILKGVALVGASVAGLTAILGTFGFLTFVGFDNRLGLNVGLRVPLDYISEGGMYVAHTAYNALWRHGFTPDVIASLLVLAAMFLGYWLCKRTRSNYDPRHHTIGRILIYTAGIGLVLLQFRTLTRLTEPLKVGDFLTTSIVDTTFNEAMILNNWRLLRGYYGSIAACFLITTATLVYWFWKASRSSESNRDDDRFRMVLRVFGLAFVLIILYGLPMTYGALVKSIDFPTIVDYRLKAAHSVADSIPTYKQPYLIQETKDKVVIYDAFNIQITYFRGDALDYVTTAHRENILTGRPDILNKRCRSGYFSARTAADTARVDQLQPWPNPPIPCAELRRQGRL